MYTVYNIYNKFDKFLEDDPPPQRPIIDTLKSIKDNIKDNVGKHFDRKPPQQPPQQTPTSKPPVQPNSSNRQVQPQERIPSSRQIFSQLTPPTVSEKRSKSLFGKIERSWETKNEIAQAQPISLASQPKKGPKLTAAQPMINSENDIQQDENDYDVIDKNNFLEDDSSTTIEDIYYKENSEVQIASELLKKYPRNSSMDRLANVLENLQTKEKYLQGEISSRAGTNQHLIERGFVQVDSIVFRVNSCFARTQRARQSLKFLQENHTQLGIRIQKKLTVQKQKEQQLQFLLTFKERYLLIIKMLQQMDDPNRKHFTPTQLRTVFEKILQGLNDLQELQFMKNFRCFENIRQVVEGKRRLILNTMN